MTQNKTIALGIGNPLLQDDRVGLEVVNRLSRMNLPIDIHELYTVGFGVLDRLMGYEQAFVVDACKLGYKPGTIVETCVEDIFTSHSLSNSHAITLGATIKTGYALCPREMPGELSILLIEVEKIENFTDIMTPAVESAVDKAVELIYSKFKNLHVPCPEHCRAGSIQN